jgi:UPF0755 protein
MRVLRGLMRLVFFGVVLAAIMAAAAFYYGQAMFERPGPAAADGASETVIVVAPGAGLKAIARDLAQKGLIEDARVFEIGVRLHQADGALKAGEYAIPSEASMRDIMGILRAGRSILYRITVPEGFARVQVADLVAAHEVLVGEITEMPPEGYILPETYLFQRGTTRDEILARMRQAQEKLLAELWEGRADGLPFSTPHEAVILASIVEKETSIAEETPLVASVFINRLRRGIKLQADPTIIYPITEGRPLGRRIRQSEIDAVNDYNTYQITGLPKGPIANPGRAALEAVLNPPQTDYLFFVADGTTGGHVFARTLAEHNRNVANLRRIQREQGYRR